MFLEESVPGSLRSISHSVESSSLSLVREGIRGGDAYVLDDANRARLVVLELDVPALSNAADMFRWRGRFLRGISTRGLNSVHLSS